MKYSIRQAEQVDQDTILALGRKIVDKYERTHLGDDIVDSYLRSGACDKDFIRRYNRINLLTLDGEIVGLIIIKKNEIQGFLVDIPYWGSGAAQYLLSYAENTIFQEFNEVYVECFVNSLRANGFYQKMGYKKSGITNGKGGIRAIYKKKKQ